MTEEKKSEGTPPPPAPDKAEERMRNIQAEFTRKLDNTNAQLQQLVAAMKTPAMPAAPKKSVKDVIWDDPDAAAQIISEQTEARINARLDKQNETAAKKQQALHALAMEYPELQKGDSDLALRAVEVFNAMDPADQANPGSYRTAVLTAASEQGVRPKSKRKQAADTDDGFALGGNSGGSGAPGRGEKARATEQAINELASAFGTKLDDKAKERITTKHGRRSYGEWK